jgi:hypothetical protein
MTWTDVLIVVLATPWVATAALGRWPAAERGSGYHATLWKGLSDE